MRRRNQQFGRIAQILLAAGSLLVLPSAAFAGGSADWSDAHMQSNFANRGTRDARPPIQGIDADGRIAVDATPAATRVQEMELSLNPHGWEPGAGASGPTVSPRRSATRSGFSSTNTARPTRGSSLRSAVSQQDRRATAR